MSDKIETAAERFRRHMQDQIPELADVIAPSGFVYKFIKPSKFRMIFEFNQLPQTAASGAVETWIEKGLIKPGEIKEDVAKQAEEMVKLANRVLELSYEPKIVNGPAANENEISASEIPDPDMTFLCAWVASGGVVSGVPLGTFPTGPKPDANARNDGKVGGNAVKRAGRHRR